MGSNHSSAVSENRTAKTDKGKKSSDFVAEACDGETLADAAYRQLREDVIRGVREPGERLRIEKLKLIYGIGPTPIREALQKLSADQLVVTQGNRGFAVAPLVLSEFEDLNIARTSIEKEAIRLSVARGDNSWEANIVAAHYLLKKEDKRLVTDRNGVTDSWELANTAFHSAIVEACGSGWLLRCRASLADLCARYRRTSIYQRRGERDLATEHNEIAEAVLDRDATTACSLIENHFALTGEALLDTDSESVAIHAL